jgi:type I restriction enzyme R subunit
LKAHGWTHVEGSLDDPAVTGRRDFAEVIQEGVLREQLDRINRRDGAPWLDDERLAQAVGAITRMPAAHLLEVNERATDLLLGGIAVEGLPGWDGGRNQIVHYIDWEVPENNRFTVINQFQVKCPPGHDTPNGHIIPDLVLLVNGIPLVVVECEGRNVPEGLSEAIDQLRRYANRRKAEGEVMDNEGAPALFHTNQLCIASNYDDARLGTISAAFAHYLNWKTVAPRTEAEVAAELGVAQFASQQRLIAGVLTPANLLDIVRHYCLFMTVGGQRIKVTCRYQQYRAVTAARERLRQGKTRVQDGEMDRRDGIIWHTQGSGKSLTMVFLVRVMRTDPALRCFKVVVVTDRKDLQNQFSETASLPAPSASTGNAAMRRSRTRRPRPAERSPRRCSTPAPTSSSWSTRPTATRPAICTPICSSPCPTARVSASPARRSSWGTGSAPARYSAITSTATPSASPSATAPPCPCSMKAAPPRAPSRRGRASMRCSRICSASAAPRSWRRSRSNTPLRARSSRRPD